MTIREQVEARLKKLGLEYDGIIRLDDDKFSVYKGGLCGLFSLSENRLVILVKYTEIKLENGKLKLTEMVPATTVTTEVDFATLK
jgi:hypothetical protein